MVKNKIVNKVKKSNSSLSNKQKETRTQMISDLFKLSSEATDVNYNVQFEKTKEILQLLEKIQKIEKDIFFPTYKREENFVPFIKWFTEHGGMMDDVEISHFEEGYGLICKKPLKHGDKVISVPKSIIMTTENARHSALGDYAARDIMIGEMQNIFLSLYLLDEYLDETSIWLPYLKVLPSQFSLVLNFTADQLYKLKGSSVFERAMNLIKSIARQYGYFYVKFVLKNECSNSSLPKYFTYDAYRWAVSCVMTRLNVLPIDDTSDYALSPIWDMANHSSIPISTDMDQTKNELTCFSATDFAEGSQFYIFYGQRTNAEFFLNNGFVIDPNPFDAVFFKLGINRDDPSYDKKALLLNTIGVQHSGKFSITNESNPITDELKAFIRISNLSSEGMAYWTGNLGQLKQAMVDTEFYTRLMEDKRAKSFLLTRLEILLRSYPANDEPCEDKCGIEKRISDLLEMEKKILLDAIKYLESKPSPE